MNDRPAIGIDLGGTKIEVLALAPDGATRLRRRIATPRGDYAATIGALRDLVAAAEAEVGASATVGVGHPGSLSPHSGLIRNANSVWLNGQPFGADVEAALARPCAFANDADCLALSEATDGAGSGARAVFAIIVGTGTGGGLVLDGKPIRGANGIAGEWGHNPLPWPDEDEWPGPVCWCGQRGCIETWLSGTALGREVARALGEGVDGATAARRAETGDAAAAQVLDRYLQRFAKATASVINIFDPDVIVVGGGVSNLEAIYAEVPRRWPSHVFADSVSTALRQARHGDSSGVRGAAWLWPDPGPTPGP